MATAKDAIKEKLELLNNSPRLIEQRLNRMAEAIFNGDYQQEQVHTTSLAKLLGETMALSDLLGRRRTLLEADAKTKGRVELGTDGVSMSTFTRGWAYSPIVFARTPVVPEVPFREAIADLMDREPRLARSSEEVRRMYTEGPAGFAVARIPAARSDKARLTLTKRIRDILAKSMEKGRELKTIREKLSAVAGITKHYAENIYRTNLATSYTAGRMAQFRDPDVSDVTPAFSFSAVRDRNTRPNHAAAHGLIAGVDDDIWKRFAPPLGFQCRCDLRARTRSELRTMNLLRKNGTVKRYYPSTWNNAHPDPGFERAA